MFCIAMLVGRLQYAGGSWTVNIHWEIIVDGPSYIFLNYFTNGLTGWTYLDALQQSGSSDATVMLPSTAEGILLRLQQFSLLGGSTECWDVSLLRITAIDNSGRYRELRRTIYSINSYQCFSASQSIIWFCGGASYEFRGVITHMFYFSSFSGNRVTCPGEITSLSSIPQL